MIRTFAAACLLAALAGPGMAASPPPAKPTSDCSGLTQARANVRKAAAPLGYQVFDLDGSAARDLLKDSGVPAAVMTDHLTVLVNQVTGRGVALLNGGPRCAFEHVVTGLKDPLSATPIAAALDYLRLAR